MTKILLVYFIVFIIVSPKLSSCPLDEEEDTHPKVIFEQAKSIKSVQNLINECLYEYPQTTLLLIQVEGVITEDPTPQSNSEIPSIPYQGLIMDTPEEIPLKARGVPHNTMVDYLKKLIDEDVPIIFMSHLLSPFKTIEILKFFRLVEPDSLPQKIPLTDATTDETYYYGINDNFIWNELTRQFPPPLNLANQHFYQYVVLSPLLFFSENSVWEQVIIINHNYNAPHLEDSLKALEKVPYLDTLEKIILIELDSFIGKLK